MRVVATALPIKLVYQETIWDRLRILAGAVFLAAPTAFFYRMARQGASWAYTPSALFAVLFVGALYLVLNRAYVDRLALTPDTGLPTHVGWVLRDSARVHPRPFASNCDGAFKDNFGYPSGDFLELLEKLRKENSPA